MLTLSNAKLVPGEKVYFYTPKQALDTFNYLYDNGYHLSIRQLEIISEDECFGYIEILEGKR